MKRLFLGERALLRSLRWNSWKYTFVEVSGHNFEISQIWVFYIEEGRAASESPRKKFGYFLSIAQQAVSANIIPNSAVQLLEYFPQKQKNKIIGS